jgi:hypothetical protein
MRLRLIVIALFACCPSFADLTARYKCSVQTSKSLPAAVSDAVSKQLGMALNTDRELRIQGDRLYSNMSGMVTIMDRAKKQITLIHPATKRYATFESDNFADQLSNLVPPAARQIMDEMQTEEFMLTVKMEMPNPGGAALAMRLETHSWIPVQGASERFPALKQWDADKWAAVSGMDGLQGLGAIQQKMMTAMADARKQMGGMSVKTETAVFVPMLAQLMQSQGASAPPDEPLLTMVITLDHIDADPVPDSAFAIPQGYQEVPLSELMQSLIPKPTDIH